MASNSLKKIATNNVNILKTLHYSSLAVIVSSFIIIYIFSRPSHWFIYLLFQTPLVVCEYIIESTGRPVYQYDNVGGYQKLIKSGQDLNQSGLTEYLFDVIYFNWILDLLVVIFGTNKIMFLWLVVPGYISYKLSGFILPYIFPKKSKSQSQSQSQAEPQQEKSKRQQKLEKNPRKVRVTR